MVVGKPDLVALLDGNHGLVRGAGHRVIILVDEL